MSESYNGWTLNSVGDAPDIGATSGCGTREVANLKSIVDKVGPPNAHRLLEIGSPTTGRLPVIDDATNYHSIASSVYREDSTNGYAGIGAVTPVGIIHALKDCSAASQKGFNKNFGPLGTGFTRDESAPMVNLADSGVLTDGNALNFSFAGNYQGMVGHGDMHAYLTGDGNSYFCRFSIRFATETTVSITLDIGDITGEGQKFFIADAGTGIRLLISASAAPNYNPILIVKNSFGQTADIAYNLYLRKCIFS